MAGAEASAGVDAAIPQWNDRSQLAVSIAVFTVGIVSNATIALSPLLISGMAQYLEYSDGLLGTLAGAESSGAAITTIAAIFCLDRAGWPLRRTALVALVAYALGNAAMPLLFGHSLALALAFFVCGGASGMVWAVCATTVATFVNNSRTVAIFYGIPYITGMACQPFLPSVFLHWGVGAAFRLVAASTLAGFALIHRIPARSAGSGVMVGMDPGQAGGSARQSGSLLWCVAIALLLQYIANSGLWVYFDRIGMVAGHSAQMSAGIVALGGGMALVGTALAAVLATRLDPTVAIVGLSLILALATIMLFRSDILTVYAGAVFLFNACITFITPSYFMLVSGISTSPGKASLISNLCMMAGFAIGPFIIGQSVGDGNFAIAIYVTTALFVVSAALVIALARWPTR